MSQPNEPPLAFESWTITVDLNDGTNIKIGSADLFTEHEGLANEIQEIVDEHVEAHLDHMRGKYSEG